MLLLVSVVGHVILWIGLVNRLHATALARRWMKLITALLYTHSVRCTPAVRRPLGLCRFARSRHASRDRLTKLTLHLLDAWNGYLLLAIAVAVLRGPVWIIDRARHRPPAVVMKHHIESIDLTQVLDRVPASGWPAQMLSRLPGNQIFQLDVDQGGGSNWPAFRRRPGRVVDLASE